MVLSGSSLHESPSSEESLRFRADTCGEGGVSGALGRTPKAASWDSATPSSRPNPPRSPGEASYLRGAGPDPGDNDLLALGLVRHFDPVSHLDVFLQDEAAAEGAFALRAIPAGPSGRWSDAPHREPNPGVPTPAQTCSSTSL